MPFIKVRDLGLIGYKQAFDIQNKCLQEVLSKGEQYLLLCEHTPVLTSGRSAKNNHLLVPDEYLKQHAIERVMVDRGGDITLHAPGQLVVYPILDLKLYKKDLHYFLHQLEEVIIALLGDFDIIATRSSLNTGAWVKDKKIASIGIGVKKWISYHGFALNVNTDLKLFSLIKPCGLDAGMTSMSDVLGFEQNMQLVKDSTVAKFKDVFNINDTRSA